MKHIRIPFLFAVIGCIFVHTSLAQITISQSQLESIFSAGSTMRIFSDTTSQAVNVGSLGGPNTYDFSSLPFYFDARDTVFSVAQIPKLTPRFPSNAITLKHTDLKSGEIEYTVFSFSNQRFYVEGQGNIYSATRERFRHNIPSNEQSRFPVTYNSQFTSAYTRVETTYVNGTPTVTSDSRFETIYVDGYGTLLLPGGLSKNCLRVRRVFSPPNDFKGFRFITQEGAIVQIESYTSQPDAGIVQTRGIYYFLGGSLSSVHEISNLPVNFSLSQNYPNPFNPSTTIRFGLPKSNYVTLKLYNLLGQEIETLVHEKLSAGEFEVKWNAENHPSGVYLYRIQAADFVETKKILLLR